MDLSNIPRDLSTQDLHLRPSALADAEGMFAMLSDPESMKYWCDKPISDIEGALKALREGLFRERWFVYGEWQDSVMLGLLKQDWRTT